MLSQSLILTVVATGSVSAAVNAQDPTIPSIDDRRFLLSTTESAGSSDGELAKKLANPVADLISIPFQFDYDEGYGPKDADIWKLNVQPVIPFTLNADWNLITGTIVPVIYQESLADGLDSTRTMSFISPRAKPHPRARSGRSPCTTRKDSR